MKIGIITIHNSPNYGACLQAFALWKYLDMQGYDAEIIDLYRPYQKEYVASKTYTSWARPRRKLRLLIKTLLKRTFQKKALPLFSDKAKQKFDAFNAQIKLSRPYPGIDDLYSNPPLYDLYISGSDQLWNPTQPYSLEPYFLTFVPKGGKKISYATSIGISTLATHEKWKMKDYLSSYTAISVRERQTQKLLSSFAGRDDIMQTPDPTFLLDAAYWQRLSVPANMEEPYLLLFTLRWSPAMVEYALKLSRESGLRLVVLMQIQPMCDDGGYVAVTDAGPKEFIGYIASADMVLTDSFHCTVFSIIMGAKNFYAYVSPDNKRGVRITDLLDTFAIGQHLLTDLSKGYAELAKEKINRQQILTQIEKVKAQGRTFLDEYIK